jgi:hypothetical protein
VHKLLKELPAAMAHQYWCGLLLADIDKKLLDGFR